MTQRWTKRAVDRELSRVLQAGCGVAELVANTLVARGITTIPDAKKFLNPDIDQGWSDPGAICGLTEVADALTKAIVGKKRILVFGDFDVDGISATAIMIHALKALGVEPDYLIPNRIDEGYGLTESVLPRIYKKDPELVITVDCGISARYEAEQLLSRGIAVLVTDHHQPCDDVPQAIPVANPKLIEGAAASILSGAGVALKLVALVGASLGRPELWRECLDLAALGTLADIVPLIGENRDLVAAGITMLNESPRPGITAVLHNTKTGAEPIRSTGLAFTLIPRLNAAGRMGDPTLALQLLITDDSARAQVLAQELEALNEARRTIEAEIYKEAKEKAEATLHGQRILIVKGEGWHEGVKGIVAARLVNHYEMPAIVFTQANNELRGSGRGSGAVNLVKAVESCSDLAIRFGGHEAAVGVTIHKDSFEEFKKRLEQLFEAEPQESLAHQLMLDDEVHLSQIGLEAVTQLTRLEPFGKDNEEPIYITRAVYLKNARAVGANKDHLSCLVSDGDMMIQGIFFKCPHIDDVISCSDPVDIIFNLRLDEWKGSSRQKLFIRHIERHAPNQGDEGDANNRPFGTDNRNRHSQSNTNMKPHDQAHWHHKLRSRWKEKAQGDPDTITRELASVILGSDSQLFDSQSKVLEALLQGASVLAIMATGRGKSLIFQVHAARLALQRGTASVFIYPLRALIADQSAFIAERFNRLGLKACPITGESASGEKDQIFQRLYEGDLDVMLTTPEFFQLHAWRFHQSGRIGFIVFDEAHHLKTELQISRIAYHQLQSCRKTFTETQFLAVTATSDDRITKGICQALSIDLVVTDDTKRENLYLDDSRNQTEREAHLASVIEAAQKTIVYVNSRAQAVSLTRFLRKSISDRPERIAFYHAGLSKDERTWIEEGFRQGKLTTIISTSAFGEGINIPDISDVVLYNLPFSIVAFNQMSGRAGRNGQEATIHLLFNEKDTTVNREILAPISQRREELIVLYRALKLLEKEFRPVSDITTSFDQLSRMCSSINSQCLISEKGIENALAIFDELELIKYETSDNYLLITMIKNANRVELSASSRYLEGVEELVLFEQFRHWVFTAGSDELRLKIISPLTPTEYECVSGNG